MLKRYHQLLGSLFRFFDLLSILLAWVLSYQLRFLVSQLPFKISFVSFNTLLPPFEKYLSLLPLVLALWWVVFHFQKFITPKD